jgi:hypothetical protein
MHTSETEMLQVRAEEASADESTSIEGVVRVRRNMVRAHSQLTRRRYV